VDTAKDMYKVYSRTPTIDLIKNRNRKSLELYRLKGQTGYWAKKDRARLEHMIRQIDAVIAARQAQVPLF